MTGNSDSRRLLPNLKRDAGRAGAWRTFPRFKAARPCWQKATGRFWMEFCDVAFFELAARYVSVFVSILDW